MMEFDPRNFDVRAAKEYLLSLLTTMKQLKTKHTQLEEEVAKWQSRVILADEKGRPDLAAQASTRLNDAKEQLSRIRGEEVELLRERDELKRQILIAKDMPEMKVDADLLLAQMQMITGEPDTVAEEFKNEEVEGALRSLKQQLDGDE